MPDSFRHPPGGRCQAAGWTPEQVRGDDGCVEGVRAHLSPGLECKRVWPVRFRTPLRPRGAACWPWTL